MLSSRRGHSIGVSDNIHGCLSGLSLAAFLGSWIFRIVSQCSKFFKTFKSIYSWIFWNFHKNTQEKQRDGL